MTLKRVFKRNTHNLFFKHIAGLGRSINRLYENRNHDIYSNGERTILRKLAILNPSVIIDGGANVGRYTLLCKELVSNCTIYSLEPVKKAFEALTQNTGGDDIKVFNKGLFRENTVKSINILGSGSLQHTSLSSLYETRRLSHGGYAKEKVELIRGDDFLREQGIDHVDFLKLDIEGAEYDALLGFENSLKSGNIRAVQFEYGYLNISSHRLLYDFYNFFEPLGYIIGKVFPKTVEFREYKVKYEDFLGPNYIAVQDKDEELIRVLRRK